MGLTVELSQTSGEYEAVALPAGAGLPASAIFLRRSARSSRRAVLHLRDMTSSFAPPDLVTWYNERGFHFYSTDVDLAETPGPRRRGGRLAPPCLAALDAARLHMRQQDGIDAIILSAEQSAATAAAVWCHERGGVDALILSDPEFGRAARGGLDIACPVLVVGRNRGHGGLHRGRDSVSLGQHVTWLHLDQDAGDGDPDVAAAAQRRRLFDEMGRWLGAYMYGQARDQLL
jgi:hypothetical protein